MGRVVKRLRTRRDLAEEPIRAALIKAGAWVHQLDSPCDLLVLTKNLCPTCCSKFVNRLHMLEVKTGKSMPREKQVAQKRFLELTATPIVRSDREALIAIGAINPKAN